MAMALRSSDMSLSGSLNLSALELAMHVLLTPSYGREFPLPTCF